MKQFRFLAVLIAAFAWSGCAGPRLAPSGSETPENHFLYSYFKGNGEDGLHLAYSQDGLRWKALRNDSSFLTPTVGTAKLMRDPSILRGPDGIFHMVWTAGWTERGIGYASSRDLIHWSEQQYIPAMEHESQALNTWAPELFYDDQRREYMIFWASTIPGRFPATDGQDASGPGRPGYNHRIYYVTTRDFRNFSRAELLYEPGFNVIDAAIVKDGKRYVMLLKDETNKPFKPQKNIRLAFGENSRGPFSAPSGPISGKEWAEGPTALKIDGKWHVYFDSYRDHRYGLVTSRDLMTWTDESDKLSMPAGIRHGTAFEVPADIARKLLAPSGMPAAAAATFPGPRSPAPPHPQL